MVEESITITVSGKETVEWIRNKIRDGAFASEQDLVERGIATLREDEAELNRWLREVVASRYDANRSTVDTAVSFDEAVQNLEDRRSKRITRTH